MADNAPAIDRKMRGKIRKEMRKLAKGQLQASSVLSARDLAGLYADAKPSYDITQQKFPRVLVNPEELQQALLWHFLMAPTPQWIVCANKALLSNTVLLLVRGGTFRSWMAAKGRGETPFLSGTKFLGVKLPRGLWHADRHEVQSLDSSLLFTARRRQGAGAREATAAASPAAVSAPKAVARLVDLCLRRQEMDANGFLPPSLAGAAGAGGVVTAPAPMSAGYVPGPLRFSQTALRDLGLLADAKAATDITADASSSSSSAATGGMAAAPPAAVSSAAVVDETLPALPRLLSIDCEMCATVLGKQLARVTVTDETDATVLDLLVKPQLPVLDYLTQYSGVTAPMLARATTTFAQAQEALLALLDGRGGSGGSSGSAAPAPGGGPAVVVGHSAESDLAALRIMHTRVIDTSVAYPHQGGLPYRHALRHLSRVHLGREIQAGHGTVGHCSEEDAVATMHLVQRLVYGSVGAEGAAAKRRLEQEAAAAAAAPVAPPASAEAEAASAPPAKRKRVEEDEATAASDGAPAAAGAAAASEPAAPAASFERAFAAVFAESARPHCVPQGAAPWDKGTDSSSSSNSSSSSGDGSTGEGSGAAIAGEVEGVEGGDAAGASAVGSKRPRGDEEGATTSGGSATAAVSEQPDGLAPKPSRGGRGDGGGGVSILRKWEFADPGVCCGVSVVGSPAFCAQHMAGPASALPCPAGRSIKDCSRVLDTVARETHRYNTGRAEGRYRGLGFVLAEMRLPLLPASEAASSSAGAGAGPSGSAGAPDWAALDRLLGTANDVLAPGCGLLVVCTGDVEAQGADGVTHLQAANVLATAESLYRDMLGCSNPTAYGTVFFHATHKKGGPPNSSAAAVAMAGAGSSTAPAAAEDAAMASAASASAATSSAGATTEA